MLNKLPSLKHLIRQLQHVPYLASRNIYRIAMHFIDSDMKQIEQLCSSIIEAKNKIKNCSICFNWTESGELCSFCESNKRNKSVICVVETWHDLSAIERVGDFDGVYHVLGGVLCPLEGVGPECLHINELLKRIDDSVEELIFAMNPTPEGEATACFIASKLEGKSILISRLASGVPIGSSLEFMDRVTIHKALSGRRPF
jgi:recombination protein RecR